jgi:hypothetical protein
VVNGRRATHWLLRSGDEIEVFGETLRFVEGESLAAEVDALCARFAIARSATAAR